MKGIRRAVFALCLASVACQAFLDFGDALEAPSSSDASADASAGPEASAPVGSDGSGPLDAPAGRSLCSGITAHFSFESTLVGRGGRTAQSSSAPSYVGGRFGQGISLLDAMELVIDLTSADATFHELGSIAFWTQVPWEPPCPESRVLFKLLGPTWTYGPDLTCEPAGLQLRARGPNAGYVQALLQSENTFGGNSWSLIVAIWDKEKDTISMMVDGQYAARIDTWPEFPPGEAPSQVVLGAASAPIGGIVDQLSFWDRALSNEEASELHRANSDILAACP